MKYDITIIGSGPGGYVAAIRGTQLGFKVAIIEKYSTLGGTCLNVGCIPSKALLDSSEHYYNATHTFKTHGIDIDNVSVNLPGMIKRKSDVVSQTCDGIKYLMKKNKIDVYHGMGSFITTKKIKITDTSGNVQEIETDKTIIATGSKPTNIPNINVDKKRVITSTEALNLQEIPKHLIVIGGGVIGVEIGSVYKRLGSEVSVVEFMPEIIPSMDKDLGKELRRVLNKQGFKFYLDTKVTGIDQNENNLTLNAENKKGENISLEADYCLVSIGRSAYTHGLGLENIGLTTDKRGKIKVDKNLQTDVKDVFAIGDVIDGPMLAHKAEEEGVFVTEYISGQKPHINYNLIPGVVYTWPEVASVGFTENQLKENKTEYKSGLFPFKALGRARASMDTDGFVKVLADKSTDEILGVHIIGPRAADMIAQAVTAMEYRASAEDVSRMSHAHPTFTEAFKEACLAATENRALHI